MAAMKRKYQFVFRGLRYDDGERVVWAHNEEEARHLAMCARWGPPTGIYAPRYRGVGLILLSGPLLEADYDEPI